LLQQADQYLQAGNYPAAQKACEQALRKAPRHPDALLLAGVVQLALGQPERAVSMLERALAADARNGAALEHLGLARLMLGQYAQAEQALVQASKLAGTPASVHMRLGIAILEQGRAQEALPCLMRAAASNPTDPDILLNLGRIRAILGDMAQARTAFEAAARTAPHRPEPAYNLGLIALQAGDPTHARLRFEQALAIAPAFAGARFNLGAACLAMGRLHEAIEHLRAALDLDPQSAAVSATLAGALFQAGRLDESKAAAERSLALDPDNAAAIGTLANILVARGDLAPAIEMLERGHARTQDGALLGMLVYLLRQTCDWERWQRAWSQLEPQLDIEAELGSPFWLLCEPACNARLLRYTRRWADKRFGPPAARPVPPAGAGTSRRFRIGYLSSDLHEHATAYLIAEVMERHDRRRFEVFAYSHGPDDGGPMRARMRAAFEHFTDIAHIPDDMAAARIREDELDLLIDLKGYTLGDRLTIMARRPCARQATWLGYPGTTAAGFMDYLIADPTVIPVSEEPHYTERVLRMPVCYQPNDRARRVAETLSRAAYGLPENAWVFCCFNQTYKITPQVFDVWMRLLAAVPGSVLWLLESNALAATNLARAAQSRAIDPARVVFAPRLPNAEHLARYRQADLALDTFPYTSHTTMSDALWCGCPAIGLCGATFAARVSSSLLRAADLPDLIAHDFEGYQSLAMRVATEEGFRQDLCARLAVARNASALFDPARFTRDLETLFEELISNR